MDLTELRKIVDQLTTNIDAYMKAAAPSAAISIAVINEATVVSDDEVRKWVDALQVQVIRDFYPYWGTYAKLSFFSRGGVPPAKAWQLVILDDADQAGALGYHDVTPTFQPLGKVFAKTTMHYGSPVSSTASHELLEMLADPEINLTVFVQQTNSAGRLYAYEVCDACEADEFDYEINGVPVSDFVLPEWFDGPQGPYDFMKKITAPLQLISGGYISYFDVASGNGWQQMFASGIAAYKMRPPVGSRRERRRTSRDAWMKSTTNVVP